MSLTMRDVLLDADLFRRAEPNWPRPAIAARIAALAGPALVDCGED